jgi:ABC-type sugar transport system substrate-binding protein
MNKKPILVALTVILLVGTMMVFAESVDFLSDNAYIENGAFLEDIPKPSKTYNIANITRTLLNEHWVKNKEGFEAALKQYGMRGQVFAVQSEQDVIEQANILQTVIAGGYDAVVVSPISEQNLLPGLAEAAQRGIVIINVDTAEISAQDAKENNIKISAFIGSDNYESGAMAARYIAEALKGETAKVGLVRGRPADTCADDRSNGFMDELKKYSNLTLAGYQSGMWDRLTAMDVTTNMLRANPDIVAIYYNNDTMVLGGMQAAEDLGYKVLTAKEVREGKIGQKNTIVLIGNDGIPEALEAVKEGKLSGTIAQKPYLMGYGAVEAAIAALEGKTLPAKIHTPVKLITQDDF